jgi:hypothetical protein
MQRWVAAWAVIAAGCGSEVDLRGSGGSQGGSGGTGGTGGGTSSAVGASGGEGGEAAVVCSADVLWARTFGTTEREEVHDVALGLGGETLLVGELGDALDLGSGVLAAGGFVLALDAAGDPLWSRALGAAANGVTVLADGSVVVVGRAAGATDLGGGPLAPHGGDDAFVVALTPAGAHAWSRLFGGPERDEAADVAAGAGRIAIVGESGADPDLGIGPLAGGGGADAFVLALDEGGAAMFGRVLGEQDDQRARGVTVAEDGTITVLGEFGGELALGGSSLTADGIDAFVLALDTSGAEVFSHVFGGAGFQEGFSVARGAAGSVVVTGLFEGTVDFAGASLASLGARDIFLVSLDGDGAAAWARSFGDSDIQSVRQVATDPLGGVLLSAPASGAIDLACGPVGGDHGSPKAALVELTPGGASRRTTVFGDGESPALYAHQYAEAAASDGAAVTLVGVFSDSIRFGDTTYDTTPGSSGELDVFVARLAR